MSKNIKSKTTCPSAPCEKGSQLLGIVKEDGVRFITFPLEIDQNFKRVACEKGDPLKRYRFSRPCVEGACKQWAAGKCSIIDKIINNRTLKENPDLPECLIRSTCRWFKQSSYLACENCSTVITQT